MWGRPGEAMPLPKLWGCWSASISCSLASCVSSPSTTLASGSSAEVIQANRAYLNSHTRITTATHVRTHIKHTGARTYIAISQQTHTHTDTRFSVCDVTNLVRPHASPLSLSQKNLRGSTKGEWERLGKRRGMRNDLGHHETDARQVCVSDWVVG